MYKSINIQETGKLLLVFKSYGNRNRDLKKNRNIWENVGIVSIETGAASVGN